MRSLLANFDDDFRLILILEHWALSSNDGPGLTNKAGASRDPQRVGDNVVTGIKEDDLASRILEMIDIVSRLPNDPNSARQTLSMSF